jgi:predicted transglutaminase-like cysteine proteinase
MPNKKTITAIFIVIAQIALFTSGAAAASEHSGHMTVTGRTSQPIGHYSYCQAFSADCNLRSVDTRAVKLSRARWSELDKVNWLVNRSVQPVTDLEHYNAEEVWTFPESHGDCEDYVLLKRKMLMELGWPPSSVLITVVRQPNGDGHAVLTARTDRADYVLDNLDDRIMPWHETEYFFLKRQSVRDSGRWEAIEDSRSTLVGSVR